MREVISDNARDSDEGDVAYVHDTTQVVLRELLNRIDFHTHRQGIPALHMPVGSDNFNG